MRIGIVNDVSLIREVLRRLVLSVPGYSVAWVAEDGAEAVRRASQDRPDVVLMDLVMPAMDGVEATRRIMAASPCPILVVTSSITSNFSLVCEAMSHGGLDAVNLPVVGCDGGIQGGEALLARLARGAEPARSRDPGGAGRSAGAGAGAAGPAAAAAAGAGGLDGRPGGAGDGPARAAGGVSRGGGGDRAHRRRVRAEPGGVAARAVRPAGGRRPGRSAAARRHGRGGGDRRSSGAAAPISASSTRGSRRTIHFGRR